jgi:hypothetical protein
VVASRPRTTSFRYDRVARGNDRHARRPHREGADPSPAGEPCRFCAGASPRASLLRRCDSLLSTAAPFSLERGLTIALEAAALRATKGPGWLHQETGERALRMLSPSRPRLRPHQLSEQSGHRARESGISAVVSWI